MTGEPEADRPIGRGARAGALPSANGKIPSSSEISGLPARETADRHPNAIPVPVAAQGETFFLPRAGIDPSPLHPA
jgi:hypothetical protein